MKCPAAAKASVQKPSMFQMRSAAWEIASKAIKVFRKYDQWRYELLTTYFGCLQTKQKTHYTTHERRPDSLLHSLAEKLAKLACSPEVTGVGR